MAIMDYETGIKHTPQVSTSYELRQKADNSFEKSDIPGFHHLIITKHADKTYPTRVCGAKWRVQGAVYKESHSLFPPRARARSVQRSCHQLKSLI